MMPVNLWFDLEQIATKGFSAVSYTEKCALTPAKSPVKSKEGKVWKLPNKSFKMCQKIDKKLHYRVTKILFPMQKNILYHILKFELKVIMGRCKN